MDLLTYGLCAFQTAVFMLSPRVSDCMCESFRSEISAPYAPVGLLNISCLFPKAYLLGAPLMVQVPGVGVLDIEHEHLALQKEALYL